MTTIPFSDQLAAARSTSAVVPLGKLIQIRVTGRDRVRFLHSFCTQDVGGLPSGHCAEAFFTNVKARVIAHGWILSQDDHHDIWMLPGDDLKLISHLERYVITEDVAFESRTADRATVALIGPESEMVLGISGSHVNSCGEKVIAERSVEWARIQWAGIPVFLVSVRKEDARGILDALSNSSVRSDESLFERVRIEERFPLVGVDIGDDHLAPEAGRDASAISYRKGCYLGQEPIARLDALGQVNRILALLEVSSEQMESDSPVLLTSYNADILPGAGLGFVRTKERNNDSFVVRLPDGALRLASFRETSSWAT